MASARKKKERKTLSDLLADDVRDYFLREGVDEPPERSRSCDDVKRKGRSNKRRTQLFRAVTTPGTATNSAPEGASLRAGWAAPGGRATPGSTSSELMETVGEKDEQNDQRQCQGGGGDERQFRGQHKVERHGANEEKNDPSNSNSNSSKTVQKAELHRRLSSGANSRVSSSHHRRNSSGGGSVGSRGSNVLSAVDAEFLRRYAEEKERTNNRMSLLARPNWGTSTSGGPAEISPDDAAAVSRSVSGSAASPNLPYHSLLIGPRPPTVAGSHRPGLPSIDNDDWEEDDRLERHERRKTERKEARRRRKSSIGGASLYCHSEHGPRSLGRMTSGGSVASAGGGIASFAGASPGSTHYKSESSTLCYSIGSSHPLPPEMPFQQWQKQQQQQHMRENSMGTFMRRVGSSNTLHTFVNHGGDGMGGGDNDGGRQEKYLTKETTTSSGGHDSHSSPKMTRHVRPLSYLSASSDSGKESGDPLQQETVAPPNYSHTKGDSNSSHSIYGASLGDSRAQSRSGSTYHTNSSPSSGSGMFRKCYGPSPTLTRASSGGRSDMSTSLLGSAIIDSVNSGESKTLSGGTNGAWSGRGGTGAYPSYRTRRRLEDEEEESSEGSYGSNEDSSDESSYTSDSYDGGSSSNSPSGGRYGRGDEANGVAHHQPANFSKYVPENGHLHEYHDVEVGEGRGERDRLLAGGGKNGRGSNYSSAETSHPRDKRPRLRRRADRRSSTSSGDRRKGRLGGPGSVPLRLDDAIDVLLEKCNAVLVMMELYISNMPSLVGSLALAWVSLGVDWFKWYEETFDACHPTSYHNKECTFAEFPGCFACETDRKGYQFFLHFHYLCSTIAFLLSSFLVGKIMIAFPVVRDELANPTTAAPLGLLCMAFEKTFAGNFGLTGKVITYAASALHTAVAVWFIFISVVYKTLPEPSWFSNTTGIGLAAAKTYLYWTDGGYFLAGFSILVFVLFYGVALYRIHMNDKISASVCWVQLSGPAVVLYGFTIFSQPGSDEDAMALMMQENRDHFYQVHRRFYMPIMHALFAFCLVSMVSSLYLLITRWKSFREKEFSPAHVSFAAPLISHANAMQAYRSSLNKFSLTPPGTPFKLWLYHYWFLCVISGTVVVIAMTWKFFTHLPGWCQIDVEDDEMPPAPDETIITRLLQKGEVGDEMKQNFVSAAVLQANESGALVRVLQDGKMKYVRSRRTFSMGFDPIMNVSELMSERDRLLQHVTYAADPSRDRGGMSSFDGVLETFHEADLLRPSSGRRKLNFMSFDASTLMRPS